MNITKTVFQTEILYREKGGKEDKKLILTSFRRPTEQDVLFHVYNHLNKNFPDSLSSKTTQKIASLSEKDFLGVAAITDKRQKETEK